MSSATHVKDYVDNVLHSESSSSTINARNRVIAATAGTIIAETLIAPTNIIKERQIQYMSNQLTSGGKFSQMPSIAQTTRDIMSEHGYMGLFQGYYSRLFKQIGYKSLVLLSYEPIRNQLWNWRAKYFASSKKSETSQFLHDMKDKIEHGKIEPSKVFHDIKEKIEDNTINPSEIMHEVKDKLHLKKRQLSAYVYDEYSRSVLVCLLSGGLAGIIGYTLMNPMEAFSSPKFIQSTQLPTGATLNDRMEQTKYSGKSRFWLKPNLMYVFLIYATEFGGYDYIKSYIMNNSNFATQYNMSMTYVVSAVLAGTCSAFISVPADIIRKRSMDPISKAKISEGVLSHITRQIKEEGTYAFRQKLMVNMIRKTLWLSGFFLTYEQVRHYVNINYSNAKIMYH